MREFCSIPASPKVYFDATRRKYRRRSPQLPGERGWGMKANSPERIMPKSCALCLMRQAATANPLFVRMKLSNKISIQNLPQSPGR